jgi:hypothetical protein
VPIRPGFALADMKVDQKRLGAHQEPTEFGSLSVRCAASIAAPSLGSSVLVKTEFFDISD